VTKKTSNKKIKIYGILLVVLLAVIAGGFIGQKYLEIEKPKELVTIRVPIDIWPGDFWPIVADAKGFFKEEGLKAELIDVTADYSQMIDDFADKDLIDAMSFSAFDLVDKNINGANLVAILESDSSEGGEGLIAKKEFAKLADLKGKRIGVEVGSYLEFLLETAMLNIGIDPDEYTKVDEATDSIVENFEKDKMDAAFMWEPQLSETETKYNLLKIFDTSDIRGISPTLLVMKRQFIEDNPETVQAMLRVWEKATYYILAHKEETYDLISKIEFKDNPGEHYSYQEIKDLFQQDIILNLEDNLKIFSFDSGFESIYGNLQFVGRFFQSSRGLSTLPDTNKMLTDYFIRNLNKPKE
jgi:NitT/TauT family transport system substrate-binding protein